jgi:hypothetical protein
LSANWKKYDLLSNLMRLVICSFFPALYLNSFKHFKKSNTFRTGMTSKLIKMSKQFLWFWVDA